MAMKGYISILLCVSISCVPGVPIESQDGEQSVSLPFQHKDVNTNRKDRQIPPLDTFSPRQLPPPGQSGSGAISEEEIMKAKPIDPREISCNFGEGEPSFCSWLNPNETDLKWQTTSGRSSNWIGGPKKDAGDKEEGGYVVTETSLTSDGTPITTSAMLISPILDSTGATGKCFKLSYSIDGLSPSRLRVMLFPLPEEITYDYFKLEEMSKSSILWQTRDTTMGGWVQTNVLYTHPGNHLIIIEAIPKDLTDNNRRFRGYIAVDNIQVGEFTECPGDCTFDGGLCGWYDIEEDDFNWQMGRGSMNTATGPTRDRSSSSSGTKSGGYVYISSSFPRRPGDRAKLHSPAISSLGRDKPMCLRFWTHMYGNGVGSLRIYQRDEDDKNEKLIWYLSGEAGNAWYQGQVPLSGHTGYQVIFEAEVGKNSLGDIAIDDVSFFNGPCPTAPQVAASHSADCTFELDECGWNNPGSRLNLDDINWDRIQARDNPALPVDHTMGTPMGHYLTLERSGLQRPGNKAWLISRQYPGTSTQCVSFWYYMYEPFIDSSGPSLGSLQILAKYENQRSQIITQPIWRLDNHQGPMWMYAQAPIKIDSKYRIILEGVLGTSRGNSLIAIDDVTVFEGSCSYNPQGARAMRGDCSFDRNVCDYRNMSGENARFNWRQADISRRPANLPDHTFNSPVGYVYFDIFNTNNQKPRLISPVIERKGGNQRICVSFWFTSFGTGESTSLRVLQEEIDENKNTDDGDEDRKNDRDDDRELWSIITSDLETYHSHWVYAQVSMNANKDFRIIFEGKATNGGFALDDVKLFDGDCAVRPRKEEEESERKKVERDKDLEEYRGDKNKIDETSQSKSDTGEENSTEES